MSMYKPSFDWYISLSISYDPAKAICDSKAIEMSHLDLTREWLGNVLRPYQAKERIINEVMKILSERKTLSVKTDAFTFDSGQTALLLLLHGTLPINYRGATYHIPIHAWVPHDYPRSPPLLFVVPTKEMGVRKSKEVDPSGRIREEVVHEWWRIWPTQKLETILRHLTNIFSAAPPVYAKPPEPSSPAQSSRSPISSPSQPRSQPRPQASIQGQPPPPPARPGFGPPLTQNPDVLPQYRPAPTPPPHPFPQGTHSRQSSATYPGTRPQHPASPPVPNRPARIPQSQAQSPISQAGGPILPQRPYIPQPQHQIQSQAPLSYPPQQPMSPPRSDVGQTQGYPNGYQPPAQGYYPPQMNNQSQQSQPPIPPHPQPAQQPHQPTRPPPAQSLVPPRQPIPDLLGSPEPSSLSLPATTDDSSIPPPLPPSKPPPPSLQHLHSILLPHLQASLPPLVHSLQSTQQHLLERKEDLSSGEPAIKDEMARLEAVKKVCDSTGRKLAEVVQKGEDRVNELEGKGEIGVDELVCGISIVHNQLIDLVAEDNAIEDTIYHMTRALDAERVDLDRYLKSIRSLAREQYMNRALIERILQGMGQTQGW
ncbi:ESCRT-I complex subunit TSG101 [Kwoniella mangroviensis CBS 10435]|uniref:ESCRT-I complex subunit TSG101 n=1 Tax=Kwoniella mangroviensis CBS 10435 TaxID=1331196 RepID=A0A1B9IIT4_9TREE|nr:ESCRT-I complex subunit TSG101 [Kwoniella mangroviensis CBS 10435]